MTVKGGGWIPISKFFLKDLPKNRPYTKLEAAYSLQIDYDKGNKVSVMGYSELWQWSRKRVYRFLKQMNVEITYPEDTKKKQNQKGFLGVQIPTQIRDRYGADTGQIRLIDNKYLEDERDRYGADTGQIRGRSGSTTIDTKILDTKTNNKTFLSDSDEYRLSELLFSLILKNNPKAKKPNLQTWSKNIDLMFRVDKRTAEDIEKVIRWCQSDTFWQSNILSTKKLREKFDQLLVKMKTKQQIKEKVLSFEDIENYKQAKYYLDKHGYDSFVRYCNRSYLNHNEVQLWIEKHSTQR
jgi:hypothetical protein